MKTTTKRTQPPADATPGFAIRLLPYTDLGTATLIVEDEEGAYEPISFASTINEGLEIATDDLRRRHKALAGNEDPGLCPWQYKLWARGIHGVLRVAATWNASQL
jgi:hypothetical protein